MKYVCLKVRPGLVPGEGIVGLSTVLKAQKRLIKSSNYASRLRKAGQLPAIIYGPGLDTALALCLDYKEFKKALTTSEGNRSLFTVEIEGQAPQATLLKDYQIDPLSRKVIHADFYTIDLDKPVTLKIPVVLQGKPAGAEKGGQLQTGVREVSISTLPAQAPTELVVDVSSLSLGQSLHISQIILPADMKLVIVTDLPVATVVIPKGLKAELEADEAESQEENDGAKAKK